MTVDPRQWKLSTDHFTQDGLHSDGQQHRWLLSPDRYALASAVNASFTRRKGEGLRPDFRAQLVNPPPFDLDRLLNPPKGQDHD